MEEIKNTPGVLWQAAAHPRFAALPPGASSSVNGVKGDPKAAVKAAVARGEIVPFEDGSNVLAPDTFDSEKNWPQCAKVIGDIRDQSNCGCCWAFAGAEAASDRMCIATNAKLMLPLSAQDVCFNSNYDGCNGGQIDTPWSFIKRSGAVTGGQYQGTGPFGSGLCSSFSLPHCHHHGPQRSDPYPAEGQPGCPSQSSPRGPSKCDSDAKSPHSDFSSDKYTYSGNTISAFGEAGIQQAIMSGGPVETAFTVYSDSRTMQEESITTSQEAWQVVMLSRWLDGVLRTVRSTGRSQTLGTHIGARRVTSASAVETMRVASRTVLSHLVLLQSGARRARHWLYERTFFPGMAVSSLLRPLSLSPLCSTGLVATSRSSAQAASSSKV